MSNTMNYNKISTEKVKAESTIVSEEVVAETPIVETDDSAPQVTMSNPIGVVVGCDKLNVRKYADIKSDVVVVIAKDSEVEIFEDSSTDDFFSIVTSDGVNGYCMKKYISVN